MRKLQITLMIVLSSIFLTNGAKAQNKPLACQVDEAAGLNWEKGRWTNRSFDPKPSKFILVQTENTLTVESVAKVFNNTPVNFVSCRYYSPETACFGVAGFGLYFNSKVLKGGISKMFGSTQDGTERDSLIVQPFSCTPF